MPRRLLYRNLNLPAALNRLVPTGPMRNILGYAGFRPEPPRARYPANLPAALNRRVPQGPMRNILTYAGILPPMGRVRNLMRHLLRHPLAMRLARPVRALRKNANAAASATWHNARTRRGYTRIHAYGQANPSVPTSTLYDRASRPYVTSGSEHPYGSLGSYRRKYPAVAAAGGGPSYKKYKRDEL